MRKIFIFILCLFLIGCSHKSPENVVTSSISNQEISEDYIYYEDIYKNFIKDIINPNCKGIYFTDMDKRKTFVDNKATPLFYSWAYFDSSKSFVLRLTDNQYYGFRISFENPSIKKFMINTTDYILGIEEY